MASKPLHLSVRDFVRHHLGPRCFAPHTGQDLPAWNAFCYLVQTWTAGGGELALEAMRATVQCAQPREDILQTFAQAIPAIGDWPHVREIWPQITDGILLVGSSSVRDSDARLIYAVEIATFFRGDNPTEQRKIYHHGWKSPSTPVEG